MSKAKILPGKEATVLGPLLDNVQMLDVTYRFTEDMRVHSPTTLYHAESEKSSRAATVGNSKFHTYEISIPVPKNVFVDILSQLSCTVPTAPSWTSSVEQLKKVRNLNQCRPSFQIWIPKNTAGISSFVQIHGIPVLLSSLENSNRWLAQESCETLEPRKRMALPSRWSHWKQTFPIGELLLEHGLVQTKYRPAKRILEHLGTSWKLHHARNLIAQNWWCSKMIFIHRQCTLELVLYSKA